MFWRRAGDKPVAQTVWLACCCLLATVAAMGQEPSDAPTPPLRVTVATFPPLVMERNAALVGFDLDLWKAVATEHEWQYTVEETTFPDLLARVRRGETDVALAGITITEQRETTLDFSHQYLESGLHILARKQTKLRVFSAMKALLTPDKLRWVFYLLLFIALCGHVLWLAERGESAISDHYIPGIFEAFWCVIATMTTVGYGDIAPRTLLGRLAAFGVMIVGIAFFGVALAQLSAGLAVQQFETEVTSLADLRDKRVATVAESTSVDILNDIEATVVPVHEIEDAYAMIHRKEVDAVVFDAPAIRYYMAQAAPKDMEIVGPLFDHQYYGIAMPEGSPLREPINRALLKLRTSGAYDRIYAKWFGGQP